MRAGALREPAVAVVPQQLVALGGRDVQVRVAVAVEVGRDTALAPNRAPGAGRGRDVDEAAVVVAVQSRPGEPAAGRVRADVALPVAVHHEEVEPAVAVVVDEAQPAAHHRRGVVGDAVPERALPEVEPDLRRHVVQPVPRRHGDARQPRLAGGRRPLRNDPTLLHLLEAVPAAAELRDRDRRILADAALEPDPKPIAFVRADGRDEVVRDELRRRDGQLRLDALRRQDRDRRQLAGRERTGGRRLRAAADDEQHGDVGGTRKRGRQSQDASSRGRAARTARARRAAARRRRRTGPTAAPPSPRTRSSSGRSGACREGRARSRTRSWPAAREAPSSGR